MAAGDAIDAGGDNNSIDSVLPLPEKRQSLQDLERGQT